MGLPQIYADRLAVLTPEERAQLRAFIGSDLYAKLLRIAECLKPSANCKDAGSGVRDQFSNDRANARLSEIRGWELFQVAIFYTLREPEQIKVEPEETFPDAGLLEGFGAPPPPKAAPKRRKK
jgi:hypothetical protein